MADYRLELAGRTLELSTPHGDQVILEQLDSVLNSADRLSFTARDLDLMGGVGLFSSVRLFSGDRLVFSGRVIAEQSVSSSEGKFKRLEAGGPVDLSRSIVVCDGAGVPRLNYEDTTVAAILTDLFDRHGDGLVKVGAAASTTFYDVDEICDLTEPVDRLWLENSDLGSALAELLEFGPYALAIDLDDLFWHVTGLDELTEFSLDLSSPAWSLVSYRIDRSLENCYSAVKLVSDRQVSVSCSSATAAWNSSLESTWRLVHPSYNSPDAEQADDLEWVYRRFSYGSISGLLEDHPVELVQKIKDPAGNWTYVPIDSLPLDRSGKYIIARYPVLTCPGGGRINFRNPLVTGKSQEGDVYIRYRYYGSQPRLTARYPSVGHSGWTVGSAGLAHELVQYCPDDRQVNSDRARRLWSRLSKANHRLSLTVGCAMPEDLFSSPHRLRLTGADDPELVESEAMLIERARYDFSAGQLRLDLTRVS